MAGNADTQILPAEPRARHRRAHAGREELGVPGVGLADWPALADDFYRMAYPAHRRPLLDDRVVGYGLAAALLVELLREERLTVADARVWATDREPSRSSVTLRILEYLRAEDGPLPVLELLQFVAVTAQDSVLERLKLGRHVTEYKASGLRRGTAYQPQDPSAWDGVGFGIAYRLNRGDGLHGHHLVLTGLAFVTNLLRPVMGDLAGADRAGPRLRLLPPDAQTVLACTQQAVTGAGGL